MKKILIIIVVALTLTSCGMMKYDSYGNTIKRNGGTNCSSFR